VTDLVLGRSSDGKGKSLYVTTMRPLFKGRVIEIPNILEAIEKRKQGSSKAAHSDNDAPTPDHPEEREHAMILPKGPPAREHLYAQPPPPAPRRTSAQANL